MPGYTGRELNRLRSVISRLRSLSDDDLRRVEQAVEEGRCPPCLVPFWSLSTSGSRDAFDAGLYRKLAADPLVADYSCYAFLPPIYTRLYDKGERPQVHFDGRTRGRVALFKFPSGDGYAIKPLQSRKEPEIAHLAGDAGVGPRQYPSVEEFLTEELVDGRFFTELTREEVSDDLMVQIGSRLGSMLAALHGAGIYYNDATLSDPEGRSHLLVRLPGSSQEEDALVCRLIDFGVSVLLDNFPTLEMEEVFNMARTTPEYRILCRMGLRGQEFRRFLAQYRQRLAATSREEILSRDLRFTEEGLQQAAARMGSWIIDPFRQGFTEGYG